MILHCLFALLRVIWLLPQALCCRLVSLKVAFDFCRCVIDFLPMAYSICILLYCTVLGLKLGSHFWECASAQLHRAFRLLGTSKGWRCFKWGQNKRVLPERIHFQFSIPVRYMRSIALDCLLITVPKKAAWDSFSCDSLYIFPSSDLYYFTLCDSCFFLERFLI